MPIPFCACTLYLLLLDPPLAEDDAELWRMRWIDIEVSGFFFYNFQLRGIHIAMQHWPKKTVAMRMREKVFECSLAVNNAIHLLLDVIVL